MIPYDTLTLQDAPGDAPSGGGVSAIAPVPIPFTPGGVPSAPPSTLPTMFNIDRPSIDVIPSQPPAVAPASRSLLPAEPVIAAGNFWKLHWPWLLIAALVMVVAATSGRRRRADS